MSISQAKKKEQNSMNELIFAVFSIRPPERLTELEK